MCFKVLRWCALLMMLGPSSLCAQTSNALLEATPSQCVALESGRVCYAEIQIQWHLSKGQHVCLILDDQVLHCGNELHGEQRLEFASKETRQLQLVVDGQTIATQPLQVSYVHKVNRLKRRWRLF